MRARHLMLACVATAALTLTGCSGDDDAITSDGNGVEVDITITEDSTDPSGAVIRVERGEDITLRIASSIDDEVHVHSEPDHSFPVTPGQETVETFTIDTPGTFDMESHRLEQVIAKIEVS